LTLARGPPHVGVALFFLCSARPRHITRRALSYPLALFDFTITPRIRSLSSALQEWQLLLYWFRAKFEQVALPRFMNKETPCGTRQHPRISLPKGMSVAWYGGGQQQVSRVKTLSMGGLFLCGPITLRVGAELTLVFEVPGGILQAQAVVRNVVPGEGMGVEFTKMSPQGRLLLEQLLARLLR
jgi:PilZ domain